MKMNNLLFIIQEVKSVVTSGLVDLKRKEGKGMKPQVLIVGAGPTGLALAVALQKQGIPFRIIDKNRGPGTLSRAMAVHARTLELYSQFGLADRLIEAGIKATALQIFKDAKRVSRVELGEKLAEHISPYPYLLSLAQDEHEAILIEYLQAKGVMVEWETGLLDLKETDGRVHVTIQRQGGEEELFYDYVCGCDGAHSTVRKALGLGFPGGTYEQVFFVADVKTKHPLPVMGPAFSDKEFCLALTLRDTEHARFIGLIPKEILSRGIPSALDPLIPYIEKMVPVKIEEVNWYSSYKVHHRVSEKFRVGRVFLAGDAGHIHSPAGGQGMNTGIGDAMNLGWKIAAVLQKKAAERILDSYEEERLSFAKTLVATTDRLFKGLVQVIEGKRLASAIYKEVIIPHILPKLVKFPGVREKLFKTMSQTQIHYRGSLLSAGKIGTIHGGDRLPWVQTDGGDNFKPLQSVDWQLHLYGETTPSLRKFAEKNALALHEVKWTPDVGRSGIQKNSVFLVRPDGYIAVAVTPQEVGKMQAFLDEYRIVPFGNKPFSR
jgi:2-polyprenyl-6-methoxyphenol hydroxylase-like FAD-dependent oxidoreductase